MMADPQAIVPVVSGGDGQGNQGDNGQDNQGGDGQGNQGDDGQGNQGGDGQERQYIKQLQNYCIEVVYRLGRSTLGILFFMLVLCIGVVISLSAAIKEPFGINDEYKNYFFVSCMTPCILWMIGSCACPSQSLGCCFTSRKPGSQIPCYLMFGITVFCLGSSFISAVDFLSFIYSRSCRNPSIHPSVYTSDGIFYLVKLLFVISQLQFLCRFSNVNFKKTFFTGLFILLIIAVNLTTWFDLIVIESVNVTSPIDYTNCSGLEIIDSFDKAADTYLYPFNIEYAVMSSVLLFLMWYELWEKRKSKTKTKRCDQPIEINCFKRCCQRCCRQEELENTESDPKTMLFWKSSPAGYVLGILLLVIEFVVVVISSLEYKTSVGSATAYYGIRISVFFLFIVLLIISFCLLRRPQRQRVKNKIHSKIDSALIMLGTSGCFLMTAFNLSAAISDLDICKTNHSYNIECNSSKEIEMNKVFCCKGIIGLFITDNVVSFVQLTLQAIFITQTLRRSDDDINLQTTRRTRTIICNISAILSFANIGIWVMDTFELKDVKSVSYIETFAYTVNTWRVLAHIAYPLCIFFRLHSAFCFFEININRFGIKVDNLDNTKRSVKRRGGYQSVPTSVVNSERGEGGLLDRAKHFVRKGSV